MFDFTLKNLGASAAPLSEGAEATAAGTSEAGAAGESFARALAAFAEESTPDSQSESDPESLGDPAFVVDTAGVPFLPDPFLPGFALGTSGSAAGPATDSTVEAIAALATAEMTGAVPDALQASMPTPAQTPSVAASAAPVVPTNPTATYAAVEPQALGESSFQLAEGSEPTVIKNTVQAAIDSTVDSVDVQASSAREPRAQASNRQAAQQFELAPVSVPAPRTAQQFVTESAPVEQPPAPVNATAPMGLPTSVQTSTTAEAPNALSVEVAKSLPAGDEGTEVVRGDDSAPKTVPTPSVRSVAIAAGDSADTDSPAVQAATGVSKAIAPEAVAEAPATETAAEVSTPYHVRSTAGAGTDGGRHDSNQGSSGRGHTSFAFGGGQTATPQTFSTLKLAGASFATALANTPIEDTLPADTATQIVQSLKLQWARGGGEAEIRLEPRHFGELRVALKVDDGRVNARLEAEAPVVREWLQTNQAALRHGLADQNLTLDRLEIVEPRETRDSDRRDRQHGRDGQPKPRQARRRRAEGGELFDVVA